MHPRRLLQLLTVLALLLTTLPAFAYVEERYTLPRMLNESTNIVLMKVERVNKEKKLIIYKKVADLKGKHPTDQIKHNVGVGGFNALEQKAPIDWAEPGKLAIFFHNGGASETCIGHYWYQAYAGGEWWNHSHGEPYLARTFKGDINLLKEAVEKLLKNEDVIVPCTVNRTDLRIQKVLASMKKPLDYVVVERPQIEITKLKDVAGFSQMIELPRPQGATQGGIAVDVDNDGYVDLLIIGTEGLVLLRNNQKGNFEDVTDKWGLSGDPGCRAAAFADYNQSGRWSLLTSAGKLYTNLGDKFKDDTKLLPETPKRVTNPGEAFGWADINGDGLPDILCSLGVSGLTAYFNKGGAGFEDVSEKIGLGPDGLGQEPSNFLSILDLDGDGNSDLVLNLQQPLIALNKQGKFTEAKGLGIAYPAASRPALAFADYLNNGKPGLFVTANDRRGAIAQWHMLGTFSAEEDKQLPEPARLNPESFPEIKIDGDRWQWRPVKTRVTGALEVRRSQPSPNAAYAFTEFTWPRAEKIVLHLGSENGLRAWLNGKDVYNYQGQRAFAAEQDQVEVDVKAGKNSLLLKVFDEGPVWRTSVRPALKNLYPPPAVQLYQSDGNGKFTDITGQAGDLAQLRAEAASACWADLDNDGWLDLLVTNKNGLVRYYRNQGDGTFRYANADLGLEQKFKATGVLAADFNKDGNLDLILFGNDTEPTVALISQLKMKHPAVTFRFTSPRSLIGARIQVFDQAGKLRGTRTVSGGDGKAMQTGLEPRFALPPGKYQAEVRLSSRATLTQEFTAGNQPSWVRIEKK